jgi:hypothetical protein
MSTLDNRLRVAVCVGVAVLTFAAGAESASANGWSYCKHRYGPSLVTITRDINGTPCGVNCTAQRNARWMKERRCDCSRSITGNLTSMIV